MISRKEQLEQWRLQRSQKGAKANDKNKNHSNGATKKTFGSTASSNQNRIKLTDDESIHQKETFSYSQMKSPWIAHKTKPRVTQQNNENNPALYNANRAREDTFAKTPTAVHLFGSGATPNVKSTRKENLTPARLEFGSSRKPDQSKGQLSCKAIKERLAAQSARKERKEQLLRAKLVERKEKKANKNVNMLLQPPPTPAQSEETLRHNNLKRTVACQVKATKEFMKNGLYEQARNDLKILLEEIPGSLECGEFWVTLAEIEEKVRGKKGASTVFALAFDSLTKSDELKLVQQACKDFLVRTNKLDGIETVQDLLEKPQKKKISTFISNIVDDAVMFKETEELGDYLSNDFSRSPSPASEEMEPVPAPSDDISSPVNAISVKEEESSLTKKTAKEFKSYLAAKPERMVSGGSAVRIKKERGIKLEHGMEDNLGSTVVMAAIHAKPRVAAELGTNKVMTPVRRAIRHQSDDRINSIDTLNETGYAYTPNKALLFDEESNDTPRPVADIKPKFNRTSMTPEQLRQELESLLIS